MAEPQEITAALKRLEIQGAIGQLEPERPDLLSVETGVGLARSVAQGATFGFADEVEAFAAASIRALWDHDEGEDFSDAYIRLRDNARQELAQFREDRPVLAGVSEFAGGFAVPGLGIARGVAGAATTGGRIARGAAGGAAAGALFGAGVAEGNENIQREAIQGAAVGTVAGAAFPAAVSAGRAIGRTVRSAVSPGTGASRRIAQALARDELSPVDVSQRLQTAQRVGPASGVTPATLADVAGANVRRELEGAVQTPGAASEIAEQFLTKRNKDQLQRISREITRNIGANADEIEDAITKTMATRANASAPVYETALRFRAELNDEVVAAYNSAVKTPLGKQALSKARRILNVENFDEAPLMERIHAFKQGLDDVGSSAARAGDANIARRAGQLNKGLLDLVDSVNPQYQKARRIWSDSTSYLEAIDRGREILKPGFTSAKLSREFSGMTDAQQEAFRLGAVDSIITRMRSQSAEEPNLLKIVRSPEIRDKLKAIMTPERAREMERVLKIEEDMFKTSKQVLQNSATARRLAQQADREKGRKLDTFFRLLLETTITPARFVFARAIPYVPRAMRDRLVQRENAIITRRLLASDPSEMLNIPRVSAEPSRVTGSRAAIGLIAAETE